MLPLSVTEGNLPWWNAKYTYLIFESLAPPVIHDTKQKWIYQPPEKLRNLSLLRHP